MVLQIRPRAQRAGVAVLVCGAAALPAVAPAQAQGSSARLRHSAPRTNTRKLRIAQRRTPKATSRRETTQRIAVQKPANGLGDETGRAPALQLAAVATAIAAAPGYFPGRPTGCAAITPMLASVPGSVMAGNFRDTDGNCYVWINLRFSEQLTGSEICKVALHELGHLSGLTHSPDPGDVMYSPFVSDPIPAPCVAG